MVDIMFGIVEMHIANTTPTKATECSGGAAVTFISIRLSPLVIIADCCRQVLQGEKHIQRIRKA